MNILQISTCGDSTPPKVYGPAEQAADALTTELVAMGHDVTLFATGDSISVGSLAYEFPTAPGYFDPDRERRHVEAAFAYARTHRFDIVHNYESNLGLRACADLATPNLTRMNWLGDSRLKDFGQYIPFYSIQPHIDNRAIHWVGEANHQAKRSLLANATALLLPLRWEEPFGFVMIEAMACSTPVVAVRRGVAPEIIKEGQTRYLCDSFAELVNAVHQLSRIDPMVCRNHVEAHFSSSVMAKTSMETYRAAISTWK